MKGFVLKVPSFLYRNVFATLPRQRKSEVVTFCLAKLSLAVNVSSKPFCKSESVERIVQWELDIIKNGKFGHLESKETRVRRKLMYILKNTNRHIQKWKRFTLKNCIKYKKWTKMCWPCLSINNSELAVFCVAKRGHLTRESN